METAKRKQRLITVYYLPEAKLEKETYTTDEKAGYAVHEGKTGIIGYRIFYGRNTVLIPKEIVHKIEGDF